MAITPKHGESKPQPLRELAIESLAPGGDGVARDDGRVTFVPGTVPGDRVRARVVHATSTFARAELVDVIAASPERIEPVCEYVAAGCGGCGWQHVAIATQRAAKRDFVVRALRACAAATIHEVIAPEPALGWRRRARFHVRDGRIGLYRVRSHDLVPIARCAQLEPALDRALAELAHDPPPDGELALVMGSDGKVVASDERQRHGPVEIEPDLWVSPAGFAQAGRLGNRALIGVVDRAVGAPTSTNALLELHAGAGNLTRSLVRLGWRVTACDVVEPSHPPAGCEFLVACAHDVVARADVVATSWGAIVLDPPREGARAAMPGIAALGAPRVVYVSCDAATLGRDAQMLVAAGYELRDAWPMDLMPNTPHVEVVALFVRR